MSSNVDIVHMMYGCFRNGDMETLKNEVLAPDVVWNVPGHHPLVFEENMVFTLDMPYHEFGWGTTHVEDMMLVTKDGCEALTSMDTSLRVKPI